MLPPSAGWWTAGEAFFQDALKRTDDLDDHSLLPGWDRRTVAAHVARNADALVNLLTWAATGVRTEMYTSPEDRDAAIARSAARPESELIDDCRVASARLSDAVYDLPPDAWPRTVQTAQGRSVSASAVLWMRCREVWVHAVDLAASATFQQIPDDVLAALLDDITDTWERRGQAPDVILHGPDRTWGAGRTILTGSTAALAAFAAGRSTEGVRTDGPSLPTLPRWL